MEVSIKKLMHLQNCFLFKINSKYLFYYVIYGNVTTTFSKIDANKCYSVKGYTRLFSILLFIL